ncbi:MAG TPA: c-type cytochrome [Candidatus Cybelea sp.]|nr:c-type cytochrome [Candidatus Cybelea sp.]
MLLAAAALGATLYATYCSSCHGSVGQGSNLAPPLIGKPAVDVHFMLDTGRMPAAAPYVNEIPRASHFDERQITAIVQYVLQLSPQPASSALPAVGPGNVDAGRRLFSENCAQCHGATGDGASVGANDVAPALSTATLFQIAEAIRAGPGEMPSFGADVLSSRQVDDIAHYVKYVQAHGNLPEGANAGGLSLAHDGPVAEGFIAWLFGIGALVLFVRFIGTTD